MPRLRSNLLFAFLSVSSVSSYAQGSIFAVLSGTVRDASNAVIPDATVIVNLQATGAERKATSGKRGEYIFPRLIPGGYSVRVEKSGFRRTSVDGLSLSVNDALTEDVTLAVGSASETVTITDASTSVQTRGSGVSLVVDERSIKELPLNGKDWSRLVSLAPGAGLTSASPVSGARPSYNNYIVDGVGYNNERSSGQPVGGGLVELANGPNLISNEALQEFRVITSNADATFGRSAGAQINVLTKSGTNHLHGSLYEFLRNDGLDARDYFNYGPFLNNQGRPVVPPLDQHLFGGTVGGPVMKDRLFYFFSYEGFRQTRQVTTSFTFPNAALIGLIPGDLGRFYRAYYLDRGLVTATGPGQFSPLSAANRTAAINAGFNAALFDGNAANGEAGTLLQSSTVPQNANQNGFFGKVNYDFRNGWRISGRYARANPVSTGPQFTLGSPIDLATDRRLYWSAIGEVVGVLTPTQVLEIRGGWTHTGMTQPPADGVGASFRTIGVNDTLGINVNPSGTGINSAGLLGRNAFLDNQSLPQVNALHTWQKGRLTLRSGVEWSHFLVDINNGAGRPTYTFTGFVGANGLLGARPTQAQAVATSAAASVFGANGGPTTALRQFKNAAQEYYTQADLKLSRNVTVNLGLRYAYMGAWRETNNAIANLYAVNGAGTTDLYSNPFTFGRTANRVEAAGDHLYVSDKNNFQPRVGVAWDVTGDGKTSLRAAYGTYTDRLFQLVFSAQGGLVNNPPFTLASNAPNVAFTLGTAVPVNTSTLAIFGLNPKLKNQTLHRVSAGVEREIYSGLNVTADYVGSFGRDLFGVADLNGAGGVPLALRPDTRFSTTRFIDNFSKSDYHSLQIAARQQPRKGVSFTVAYTLSYANDDNSADTFSIFPGLVNTGASSASGFQGGGPNAWVTRPRSADWGPTVGIPRHQLVLSHVLDLPVGRNRHYLSTAPRWEDAFVGGWSLSGIYSYRTGLPFNLGLGFDANDDGDTGDRPALISGSLADLYSGGTRTTFLVGQSRGAQVLGAPAVASDPLAVVGRNGLFGPGYSSYDASLFKRFTLTERLLLSFEANAFNLLNHANFANPIATVSDARFGQITATATGSTPRQMQIGAKLVF